MKVLTTRSGLSVPLTGEQCGQCSPNPSQSSTEHYFILLPGDDSDEMVAEDRFSVFAERTHFEM